MSSREGAERTVRDIRRRPASSIRPKGRIVLRACVVRTMAPIVMRSDCEAALRRRRSPGNDLRPISDAVAAALTVRMTARLSVVPSRSDVNQCMRTRLSIPTILSIIDRRSKRSLAGYDPGARKRPWKPETRLQVHRVKRPSTALLNRPVAMKVADSPRSSAGAGSTASKPAATITPNNAPRRALTVRARCGAPPQGDRCPPHRGELRGVNVEHSTRRYQALMTPRHPLDHSTGEIRVMVTGAGSSPREPH